MNLKKFLLVFLTVFLLFGCSSTSDTDEVDNDEKDPVEEKIEVGDTFSVGDYEVTINSARLGKDYEDNDIIIINYDWTNNSDETTSAMLSLYMQAFQSGEEIETAYLSDTNNDDMKDIRPGNSLEGLENAFEVKDTSEIELEVSEAFSFSSEKVLIIIDFPAE